MTRYMAVDVDSARHAGNMSRHGLDVEADGRRLAAEALRADTELVDTRQRVLLQLCVEGIRMR